MSSEPLDVLRYKLAEAHGLAIAATNVTAKVEERLPRAELRAQLRSLREDALETRARCLRVQATFDEDVALEMLAHANSAANRGADLSGDWFKAGTDPLAALAFLAMGEAAELATWNAVELLAQRAQSVEVTALAEWAVPVHERHLGIALQASAELAASLDPLAPRFG